MSLDWSVERMKNFDVLTTLVVNVTTLPDDEAELTRKWLPLTEAIIWATMHVGVNSITEDNWQEFYYRLSMWEKMVGPSLTVYGSDKPRYVTPLEVYMHIGTYSNASPLTRAQFVKKVSEIFERENKKQLNNVPERYKQVGLEHMAQDLYQSLWKQRDTVTLDQKLEAHFASIPVD